MSKATRYKRLNKAGTIFKFTLFLTENLFVFSKFGIKFASSGTLSDDLHD